MKTSKILSFKAFLASMLLIAIFLTGCQETNEFKTNEDGVKYKFYVENEDSTGVNDFDIVEVVMNYRTKDTTLYDGKGQIIPFQINPVYDGDLMDAISLMHVGDSATFALDAEDFFLNMMSYREVPEEIGDNKELFFDVKVISVRPEPDEMKADRLANEALRDSEQSRIDRFLEENGYDVEPTETGLYYIEVAEGSGPQAASGKKVKVHYNGTFLNGEKFDASYDRGAPIEFTLGKGEVIKGWDEGISMMKAGGKANLVIPSKIAYGAQSRGSIKAYSPLFFEVELVEVIE
jgi:FKBP-type peptidyl-prolyl cis-trans isomerase